MAGDGARAAAAGSATAAGAGTGGTSAAGAGAGVGGAGATAAGMPVGAGGPSTLLLGDLGIEFDSSGPELQYFARSKGLFLEYLRDKGCWDVLWSQRGDCEVEGLLHLRLSRTCCAGAMAAGAHEHVCGSRGGVEGA